MKITRSIALLLLASVPVAFLPERVNATAYNLPYTASFGMARTGLASSVIVRAFDATGTERIGPGEGNEPTIAESTDAAAVADTGAYYFVLPLDTAWGALHVKVTITGQSGIVAEGALTNAPVQAADQQAYVTAGLTTQGLTTARAAKIDNLDAAVSTRSTYSGGAVASVTGSVGSVTGAVGSVTSPVSVAGTVSANVVQVAGQSATAPAAGGVAFPSTIGTSTYSGGAVASVTAPVTLASGQLPSDYLSASEQAALGHLDANVSTRLAASGYSAAPTTTQIASALAPSFAALGTPQQAGATVTLPIIPPSGYGGAAPSDVAVAVWSAGTRTLSISPATVTQIQALLPPNFGTLVIDTGGHVSINLPIAPVVHK